MLTQTCSWWCGCFNWWLVKSQCDQPVLPGPSVQRLLLWQMEHTMEFFMVVTQRHK